MLSASPRRRELLAGVGATFQVCRSNGEEKITKEDPEEIVQGTVISRKPLQWQRKEDMEEGTVIIGADTIVFYDG